MFSEPCGFAGNTLQAKKLKKIECSSPFANYPVKCGFCEDLVWRFDLQKHHNMKHGAEECPQIGRIPAAEKAILDKKKNKSRTGLNSKTLDKLTDAELGLLPLKDFWDSKKNKWKTTYAGLWGKRYSSRMKRVFGEANF